MDGYTDTPFRRICKEINPNIVVVTEFTSTDGLFHAREKVENRLWFDKIEHPIIAQIYGSSIETFKAATHLCEEMGFDGIDINMGCPAKKVVKSEQGIALRKNPDLAYKLVEAVAKETYLPVSVKTRLGWDSAEGLVEFGKGLQNAGAKLIMIHGRTYQNPYGCPADFEPIYKLKEALDIPVFGNGGITDVKDGMNKLGNLDGFLIGQAAIGNPWVFTDKPNRHFSEKRETIKKHVEYFREYKGDEATVIQMRKHLLAYVKGIPGASQYRNTLAHVKSIKEIYTTLDSIQ